MKKPLLIGTLLLSCSMSLSANDGAKIIYGEDNRHETFEYPDSKFRELAKSVAGMVPSRKLIPSLNGDGIYSFYKKTAEDAFNLCPDERFAEQHVLPNCTGFLIAPNKLVTAGHCIESEFDCSTNKFVFDYVEGTKKIKQDNVYSCKKIITRDLKSTWFKLRDYAVIELDRNVKERAPLKVRKRGRPLVGTELVLIGHPFMLPQKIADGAKVKFANIVELLTPIRTMVRKSHYFVANLDSYGGNSGSPVFNKKTGLVEGILVSGAEDFKQNEEDFCYSSARRSNSGLTTSERVYRITKVMKALKKIEKQKKNPDDDEE